jgi:hypothetical protein
MSSENNYVRPISRESLASGLVGDPLKGLRSNTSWSAAPSARRVGLPPAPHPNFGEPNQEDPLVGALKRALARESSFRSTHPAQGLSPSSTADVDDRTAHKRDAPEGLCAQLADGDRLEKLDPQAVAIPTGIAIVDGMYSATDSSLHLATAVMESQSTAKPDEAGGCFEEERSTKGALASIPVVPSVPSSSLLQGGSEQAGVNAAVPETTGRVNLQSEPAVTAVALDWSGTAPLATAGSSEPPADVIGLSQLISYNGTQVRRENLGAIPAAALAGPCSGAVLPRVPAGTSFGSMNFPEVFSSSASITSSRGAVDDGPCESEDSHSASWSGFRSDVGRQLAGPPTQDAGAGGMTTGLGGSGPTIDLTKTNELLQQLLDEVRRGRPSYLPVPERTNL